MNGIIYNTRYIRGRRKKKGVRISCILFFLVLDLFLSVCLNAWLCIKCMQFPQSQRSVSDASGTIVSAM